VRVEVAAQAGPDVVGRRGPEQVRRVQELAVLEEVAVSVPQAGDDVSRGLVGREGARPGREHAGDAAVGDGEAGG